MHLGNDWFSRDISFATNEAIKRDVKIDTSMNFQEITHEIYEKNIDYDDLLNADEAFFTGTAVEITPITIVDNKPVNNGKRGSITKELQDKFQQIISGEDSFYESWLTYTN